MRRLADIAVALSLACVAGCDSRDVYLGSDVHPRASGSGGHANGQSGGSGTTDGAGGTHTPSDDAGNIGTGMGTGGGTGSGGSTGSGGATVMPAADSGMVTVTADAGGSSGCPDGFADCDGRTDNGCETNVDSDSNNCGKCATMCPGFGIMSFGSSCTAGVCVLNCEAPFANCDGNTDNGCESFGACP